MSDLVERLKRGIGSAKGRIEQVNAYYQLCYEAANEIERLRQLEQNAMRYRALRDIFDIEDKRKIGLYSFCFFSTKSDIDAAADKLVEAMK